MKEVKQLMNLEEIGRQNRCLYRYDISKITDQLLQLSDHYQELMNQWTDQELIRYMKFIESILLYIDVVFLEEKYVKFCLDSSDETPTPSLSRNLIVLALFEENIIRLEQIIEQDLKEDSSNMDYRLEPYQRDVFLKQHVMITPAYFPLIERSLIELAYHNILSLAKAHLFDFQTGNIKVYHMIQGIEDIETKRELMDIALEEGNQVERLKIFAYPITQTYRFEEPTYGAYWKKLYQKYIDWCKIKKKNI